MVCSLFEKIIRFLLLDVLGAFREQQKVFNLTSANFSTKSVKNPRDVATLKTSYTHSEIVKIFSTFKYGVCKTLKATLCICLNRNNYKLRGNREHVALVSLVNFDNSCMILTRFSTECILKPKPKRLL